MPKNGHMILGAGFVLAAALACGCKQEQKTEDINEPRFGVGDNARRIRDGIAVLTSDWTYKCTSYSKDSKDYIEWWEYGKRGPGVRSRAKQITFRGDTIWAERDTWYTGLQYRVFDDDPKGYVLYDESLSVFRKYIARPDGLDWPAGRYVSANSARDSLDADSDVPAAVKLLRKWGFDYYEGYPARPGP